MGVCMSKKSVEIHKTTAPEFLALFNNKSKQVVINDINIHADESRFKHEKWLIVVCQNIDLLKPSKVMVIDVDRSSSSFMKIVSETELPSAGDEIMTANWIETAKCADELNDANRTRLIVPCFHSSRIYFLNFQNLIFTINKCLESSEFNDAQNPLAVYSWPEKPGYVIASMCGDTAGRSKGSLLAIDTFKSNVKSKESNKFSVFGGFMGVQLKQNVILTAEFGSPKKLLTGLKKTAGVLNVQEHAYGHSINVWNYETLELEQSISLDDKHAVGFTCIRFVHNPECNHAFACSAIGGCIFHIHKISKTDEYKAEVVIHYKPIAVDSWHHNEMPALPLDLVISMDDRYMYVACYLHGFIDQFDVSDPFRVTSRSRIDIGGCISRPTGSRRRARTAHKPVIIGDQKFEAGPAKLQLSLDGRRLYVTNSFYTPWDCLFYPNLQQTGGCIILVHTNTGSNGKSMVVDEKFCINLNTDDGLYLGREMKFSNGDCTSDSFTTFNTDY